MSLDLAVLLVLGIAAVLGAATGALRQLVQILAVGLGWLAARQLAPAVATGLERSLPPLLARATASAVLFVGIAALVSLVGRMVLAGTGVARVVRGPADRAIGALLGGVKAGAAVWVLLSAAAIAGEAAPHALAMDPRTSDFAALATRHNLLARIAPEPVRALDRLRGGAAPRFAPTPGGLRGEVERQAAARERAIDDATR
jgi:membrane protein required for colicin V production